jgi:hypothetical protein
MLRWLYFLLAVAAGLGIGLYYGWVVSPVEFYDTSPDTLRIDYKVDYILMTAEAFARDGDVLLARRRLAILGEKNPAEAVQEGIEFAVNVGYAIEDLAVLRDLGEALLQTNPAVEPNLP